MHDIGFDGCLKDYTYTELYWVGGIFRMGLIEYYYNEVT